MAKPKNADPENAKIKEPLLRILFGSASMLGPGKVGLLEAIDDKGSISAAARQMGMSYRRAWNLIDAINKDFSEPVVLTNAGGRGGGGASVTPFGLEVVARYRDIEKKASASVEAEIGELGQFLAEN